MSSMTAAALVDVGKLELRDIPVPGTGAHDVLVRTAGVGICGTDFHIYGGFANYHADALGKPIPLTVWPQVLGHEISGVVEEVGSDVRDLRVGDRVLVDQGLNCRSQQIEPECEYCQTGASHHCAHYREHGITGLQGGFAQYIAVPAVNAVRLEGDLPRAELPMGEPLACVLHATELAARAAARYTFTGERPIRNILILGAGPAGLLFLQYYRNVVCFDGPIFVADLNAKKLALAASFGATILSTTSDELVREVMERTGGERIYFLVEATGAGAVFRFLPGLLRKQATLVLYGHGHEGADMSLLNSVQFLEPTVVTPAGASGGFDPDGRPAIYRRALEHLTRGRVRVAPILTHPCRFEDLARVFAEDYRRPDFVKAVLLPE